MKKLCFLVSLGIISFVNGQTRVSLLEEFTGETCPPCAVANPALDYLLEQPANAAKIIALKWQVPIPSPPSNPGSLYQTNQAEIDWRYRGVSSSGYGYPSQYTPTHTVNDGIANAPTCFIDGKNQWAFGATSDHPYYLSNTVINTAAAVSTPFSINMATSWNASFNNCVVTVTVTSSSAFTAIGNLMFRLCLVERYIKFQVAPGSNGEKIFHDAVRKCYPTTLSGGVITSMGTSLPSSWTAGQVQVLTINCAIPSYILDRSQMAFVGFIQDDGNRQIYQAARTAEASIPNDAKAGAVNIPLVVCSPTVLPTVTIKNNGPNAITALAITPSLDGVSGANIIWSGNLAALTSTTIPMNVIMPATGSHTYAYSISAVSGGDIATMNNDGELIFFNASTYFPAPVTEDFEGFAFPPANWLIPDLGSLNTFVQSISVGYASFQSLTYPLFYAPHGEIDEFYLPPSDLIGTTNSELKFDLAYQQLPGSKDSLKVFLSSDCGNNWVKMYSNGGTSMATAPLPNNTSFSPSGTEWASIIIPLAGFASSPQVLIKFHLKADGGNGIFIDNINVKAGSGTPTGSQNTEQNQLDFSIYPNPANAHATVVIHSTQGPSIELELQNALGQVVYSRTDQLSAGSTTIDCRDLPAGIYFVKIKDESRTFTKKLVIAK